MKTDQAQIARIERYEAILDAGNAAVRQLREAIEAFEAVQPSLQALGAYYAGADWLADYDADAAGRLPAALKRGVLSQDAVYDLLAENQALRARLAADEAPENK